MTTVVHAKAVEPETPRHFHQKLFCFFRAFHYYYVVVQTCRQLQNQIFHPAWGSSQVVSNLPFSMTTSVAVRSSYSSKHAYVCTLRALFRSRVLRGV